MPIKNKDGVMFTTQEDQVTQCIEHFSEVFSQLTSQDLFDITTEERKRHRKKLKYARPSRN